MKKYLVVSIVFMMFFSVAHAGTAYSSISNGLWSDANNWTPSGGPPGATTVGNTDNATIRSNQTITIDGTSFHLDYAVVGSFTAAEGPGTLLIQNGGGLFGDAGANRQFIVGARADGTTT